MSAPTDLYRYFDANDVLLYVGISKSAIARAQQHSAGASWWSNVVRMTREVHPTRQAAIEAERVAIIAERPLHNVVHNGPKQTSASMPREQRQQVAESLQLIPREWSMWRGSMIFRAAELYANQFADATLHVYEGGEWFLKQNGDTLDHGFAPDGSNLPVRVACHYTRDAGSASAASSPFVRRLEVSTFEWNHRKNEVLTISRKGVKVDRYKWEISPEISAAMLKCDACVKDSRSCDDRDCRCYVLFIDRETGLGLGAGHPLALIENLDYSVTAKLLVVEEFKTEPLSDVGLDVVGLFVLTCDGRPSGHQGLIRGRFDDAVLVQWFDWLVGDPTNLSLEPLDAIGGWRLYNSYDDWRRAGHALMREFRQHGTGQEVAA